MTETLVAVQNLPAGAFLESSGLVVAEAENFTQNVPGLTRNWLTATAQSSYTGTAYMQALPDTLFIYINGITFTRVADERRGAT